VAGVLTFLFVESAMLGVTALLNTPEDDAWLRKTLADPSFYVTEAGVLGIGALTGLLGASAASLVAVAGVLIQAGGHSGATKDLLIDHRITINLVAGFTK